MTGQLPNYPIVPVLRQSVPDLRGQTGEFQCKISLKLLLQSSLSCTVLSTPRLHYGLTDLRLGVRPMSAEQKSTFITGELDHNLCLNVDPWPDLGRNVDTADKTLLQAAKKAAPDADSSKHSKRGNFT